MNRTPLAVRFISLRKSRLGLIEENVGVNAASRKA
jgi:hypothetical protein